MEKNKTETKPVDIKTKEIELPKLDLNQYIGVDSEIESIQEFEHEKNGFYVQMKTKLVGTFGEGKNQIELRGSQNFGLQKDKEGQIGWGVDTKLGKYLAKREVKHYNDLLGKPAKIQIVTNDGRDFLSFV